MTRTTMITLAVAFAVVIAFVLINRRAHPTTEVVQDANEALGASVALGGNLGPARYSANVPFLLPPPLAFMMPLAAGRSVIAGN